MFIIPYKSIIIIILVLGSGRLNERSEAKRAKVCLASEPQLQKHLTARGMQVQP